MFSEMLDMINREVLGIVYKVFPAAVEQIPFRRPVRAPRPQELTLTHREALGLGFQANREPVAGSSSPAEAKAGKPQPVRVGAKVGRNDPCPCGGGKKYKNCHGR